MALKAISSGNGNRIEAEQYSFDNKGDAIEGHLIESVKLSKDGNSFMKYVIKTSHGHVSTLGSYQLDRDLALVSLGTLVRITFLGKKKLAGGRTVKEFTVEADSDNKIATLTPEQVIAQARVG